MSSGHPERMGPEHRLTRSVHFEAVRLRGIAHRGRHSLLLALEVPGEATRLGVVASRRSVGDAVRRNRARRRLREIVRRRWPALPHQGWWLVVIAHRTAAAARHEELVDDLLDLLAQAGIWKPGMPTGSEPR
jgi:ribonuclease P protein component